MHAPCEDSTQQMKRVREEPTVVYNNCTFNGPVNNYTQCTFNYAPAARPASPALTWKEERAWAPPDDPSLPRLSAAYATNLRVKCCSRTCKRNTDPEMFAPAVLHAKKCKAYEDALTAYGAAVEAENADALIAARATIGALATVKCEPCRESIARSIKNPGTKLGDCYVEWERLKREVFHTCGKCGAQRAVEANHGATYAENAKRYEACVEEEGVEVAEHRYPKGERKVRPVSDTSWWSRHGGVHAMRAEAAKCDPLCRMCHMLDPSSYTANCNRADPARVKRKNYATQKEYTDAVKVARYSKEKREYVNALKRAVGRCERPDCPRDGPSNGACVAGFEQCYDWDHLDPTTKGRAISAICAYGRSFKTAKPEIDAERAKCRLLCRNCHITRKEWD